MDLSSQALALLLAGVQEDLLAHDGRLSRIEQSAVFSANLAKVVCERFSHLEMREIEARIINAQANYPLTSAKLVFLVNNNNDWLLPGRVLSATQARAWVRKLGQAKLNQWNSPSQHDLQPSLRLQELRLPASPATPSDAFVILAKQSLSAHLAQMQARLLLAATAPPDSDGSAFRLPRL